MFGANLSRIDQALANQSIDVEYAEYLSERDHNQTASADLVALEASARRAKLQTQAASTPESARA